MRKPPTPRGAGRRAAVVALGIAGALVAAPRGGAAQALAAALPAPTLPSPGRGAGAVTARAPRAADAAAADAAAIAAFWSQVGDPVLARLESDALAGSPAVGAARARLARAGAARRLRTFDLAPGVTASAGYTRRRLSAAQFPGIPASLRQQTLFDAGLDASWEVDVFGRTRRALAADRALERSSAEALRDVQVAVAAEVARAYYDWRGARRELAVAARNAANQRRTRQLTLDRLAGGRGTGLDRERAESQLSTTLAAVPQLEARASAAAYRLGALVGRDPDAVAGALAAAAGPATPAAPNGVPVVRAALAAAPDGAAGAELPAPVGSDVDAWPAAPDSAAVAAAVERRPDVQAAARQLAARQAVVAAARADYLPRLAVVAGVGRNAGAVDGLRAGDAVRYSVGPVISWPAFDLGRVRTRVSAARADAEEARARYAEVRLTALGEAGAAWTGLARARARIATLARAAAAGDRGAALARVRFAAGAAGFLDVLDAERSVLEAQRQLAVGEAEAAAAAVALYETLGGAWAPGAPAAVGGRD
jgi:outer membrane protein TolC